MTTDKNVKLPKQVMKMMGAGVEAPVEAPVVENPPAAALDIGAEQPPEPAIVAPKVPPIAGNPNWEAMYHTLKGKYDAEVPALMAQNRELRAELEKTQTAPPVKRIDDLSQVLSEEEREELGEEVVGGTAKMIQQVRAESAQELNQLRDQLQSSDRQAFIGTLTGLCPTVAKVNQDPAFHAWLNETIPLTGQTKFALLRAAERQLDAVRCAEIFNAYVDEINGRVPKHDLNELAVPRPVTGGEGRPVEKPVYTESQVRAFYEDMTKGRFRNNPEKAVRMDQEITAAAAEGRIVKG
jgi:hypothetical protein